MNHAMPTYTRYRLSIEYKGDFFYGWQRQPDKRTVQGEIENALAIILREKVTVHSAGRTDAGVHALNQVAHFDASFKIKTYDVLLGINYFLRDKGAAVLSIEEVDPYFHARFSAKDRSYNYYILNRCAPSILRHEYAWHIMKPLNFEKMQRASADFMGVHDFSAFRDADCQAENPVRKLDEIKLTKEKDIITVHVRSRAFLHHQVRIMVGTLKNIGEGRISEHAIPDIIASGQRKKAGQTAPAGALFFLGPTY